MCDVECQVVWSTVDNHHGDIRRVCFGCSDDRVWQPVRINWLICFKFELEHLHRYLNIDLKLFLVRQLPLHFWPAGFYGRADEARALMLQIIQSRALRHDFLQISVALLQTGEGAV